MISENRDTISRRMVNALKLNNRALTEERNELIDKNMLLSSELAYFKSRCADLEEEVNTLERENSSLKARNLSYAQRFNGADFARSLLGKPMTDEDIAIEEAENCYIPYTGDDF